MNRAEFMAALEAQLRDITTEERDEALKFYNEYLDEAGPENEAAVLAELGSPQKRSTALPMHTAIPKTARNAKTADAPPPTARSGSSCSFSPVPSGSASSAACSAA